MTSMSSSIEYRSASVDEAALETNPVGAQLVGSVSSAASRWSHSSASGPNFDALDQVVGEVEGSRDGDVVGEVQLGSRTANTCAR